MAAPAHTASTPNAAASAAALAFFHSATAVFSSAWAQQHRDADADEDPASSASSVPWSQHGSRLRADVAALAAIDEAQDDTDVPVHLLRACLKIGQDVILRLDRLENSAKVAWDLGDLVVLAERLDSLIQQTHDVENSPFIRTSPAEELRSLERQLAVRLAPHAPHGDAYDNGEQKVDAQGGSKEPDAELKRSAPPEDQPRDMSPEILQDFILEGLAYKSMHDREDEVTEAYASTFDWVFADQTGAQQGEEGGRALKHGLKDWLSTTAAGPLYWITGKPGSGKSTFIRYLFQHPATAQCLASWSGDAQPVLVAGFFFWTSGSREQRSQTGLLRSLLHQFLAAHPAYTAAAFPALWARLRTMPTKARVQVRLDWTVEELLPAFRAFIRAASAAMKICLFVDGMDEFEGDHAVLIDLFRSVATGPGSHQVKMCLSSRPWAVFADAFAFAVPNLKLQELTYGDMQRYVSEMLRQNSDMRATLDRDPADGARFVEALVDRADGVFLWVRLAVEKILERSSARADGVEALAAQLVALPAELDDLFAQLLFADQTPAERQQTATLYSLMRAREAAADFVRNDDANNLTVWELAFALDEDDDRMLLDRVPVEAATDSYIRQRGEATIRTIRQRFAGLLDVHIRRREGKLHKPRGSKPRRPSARGRARSRVVYIHRTVRDWLVSGPGGVHARLLQNLPAGFDAHLRLLRSYVLQLKRPLGAVEHHRMLDDWWPGITLAMTHARYVARDPARRQRPFVNELASTVAWYWAARPDDPYDHWARSAFGSFEVRAKAPPIWQPFLALAVKFGLRTYVAEELAAAARRDEDAADGVAAELRALQVDDAVPLLAYATEYLCDRQKTIYPLSDPGLVEDLLRAPAAGRTNPGANHGYLEFATRADTTPWLAVLRHLRDARRRRWIKRYDVDDDGTRRWARIVRLFLEVGGADPDAVIQGDMWDPEITAEGVLELLDDTYADVEIRGLRDLLRGLREKSQKSKV
ncbi:hypothetical protein CCM_01732 [Cordyceps militaris CM01]|uniref:Uncharacterized protein n=1 Tax=Cordyceps militaris (strain CM01) TaxID=983644 RepID=G3J700_CORMM|nr:uncharacterized protein CCM_01732 [Cordyceps militaris CM01]EGX97073.1 hypothetical protein CCM_01732 [Cordyceps militaris CM01]